MNELEKINLHKTSWQEFYYTLLYYTLHWPTLCSFSRQGLFPTQLLWFNTFLSFDTFYCPALLLLVLQVLGKGWKRVEWKSMKHKWWWVKTNWKLEEDTRNIWIPLFKFSLEIHLTILNYINYTQLQNMFAPQKWIELHFMCHWIPIEHDHYLVNISESIIEKAWSHC